MSAITCRTYLHHMCKSVSDMVMLSDPWKPMPWRLQTHHFTSTRKMRGFKKPWYVVSLSRIFMHENHIILFPSNTIMYGMLSV